jgi:hypothetical protein
MTGEESGETQWMEWRKPIHGQIVPSVYVLYIRISRAGVTILVRQRGHSRELRITSSAQSLHMARWLRDRSNASDPRQMGGEGTVPAVDDGHGRFLVLTDRT